MLLVHCDISIIITVFYFKNRDIIVISESFKKAWDKYVSFLLQGFFLFLFAIATLFLLATFNVIGLSGEEIQTYCSYSRISQDKLTAEQEVKFAKCKAIIARIAIEERFNQNCTNKSPEDVWKSVSRFWDSYPTNLFEDYISGESLVSSALKDLYPNCPNMSLEDYEKMSQMTDEELKNLTIQQSLPNGVKFLGFEEK